MLQSLWLTHPRLICLATYTLSDLVKVGVSRKFHFLGKMCRKISLSMRILNLRQPNFILISFDLQNAKAGTLMVSLPEFHLFCKPTITSKKFHLFCKPISNWRLILIVDSQDNLGLLPSFDSSVPGSRYLTQFCLTPVKSDRNLSVLTSGDRRYCERLLCSLAMYLLTLSDLDRTINSNQLQEPPLVPYYIQKRLQLLVKQNLMGLPVEPILNSYPQFKQWVFQLKELSPSLFLPQRKLFVDIPIQAKIDRKKRKVTEEKSALSPLFKAIQVRANVGLVKGTPKLIEWAIRHPALTWQDRVKLWVAAEFFELEPHKLQLIVLALHPTQRAQKVQFTWNSKQHRQTQNWLVTAIERETEQPSIELNAYLKSQPKKVATAINLDAIDLDEINEVSI